jgi:putative ABC transport system permease protein
MWSRDTWQEIFATLRKNKLRTILTALSVAWGIFILVILLGAGNGLRNGTKEQFLSDAINAIWIDGGTTSLPYSGIKPGRSIRLKNEDFDAIKKNISDLEYVSAQWDEGMKIIGYGKERASFLVRACLPDHRFLENITVEKGRFINPNDIEETRKVCCIGKKVAEGLFHEEDPVGKYLDAQGTKFRIVGVFDDRGRGDLDRIYIPLSTAQKTYNAKNEIDVIWVTTGNAGLVRTEQMVDEIRRLLAVRHRFDPADLNALGIWNKNAEYKRIMNMLDNINIFVWIIGIGTLIAGIVGVSNIMLIIVKERTREIGIRKSIGATPWNIVKQILMESVFITSFAGYSGLCAGIWILHGFRSMNLNSDFFQNPDVDLTAAVSAVFLLILAGAIAGLIPAMRAASVQPVVALRAET